jgi:hypothetical protein
MTIPIVRRRYEDRPKSRTGKVLFHHAGHWASDFRLRAKPLLGTTLSLVFLMLCVLMLCVGCAAGRNTLKHTKLSLDCIEIRTIGRWRVLDPLHVVIYPPDRSAAYLFELGGYCERLAQAPDHIALSSRDAGRLCANGEDALLVEDQRCVISTIVPYKTSE